MIAGGDRIENKAQTSQGELWQAQRYICGGGFYSNPDNPSTPQNESLDLTALNITWNTPCITGMGQELQDFYAAIGVDPENVNWSDPKTVNANSWYLRGYAEPVDVCAVGAGLMGPQPQSATTAATSMWAVADICMAGYADGTRKIRIGNQEFALTGPNSYFDFAAQMINSGVSPTLIDQVVPPNVMQMISGLTGGDAFLNSEVVRLYLKAISRRPAGERLVPEIQTKVGKSLIDQLTALKAGKTADEFKMLLVKSYVDEVMVVMPDYKVIIRQIPPSLTTPATWVGTNLSATDVATVRELRRFFEKVEDQIKDLPQVKAYLNGKLEADRDTFLASIRTSIATKLIPAVKAKITNPAVATNQIAATLYKYYAEAIPPSAGFVQVTNGVPQVQIDRIELKDRPAWELSLPPASLIDGVGARTNFLRLAAITQIWRDVVRLAQLQGADAASPGQLQDDLVRSILTQITPQTPTDQLTLTYVTAVSTNVPRSVTLETAPTELLGGQTGIQLNQNAGDFYAREVSLTLYIAALEMWRQSHNNQPMAAADRAALAGAIRARVDEIEHTPYNPAHPAGTQHSDSDPMDISDLSSLQIKPGSLVRNSSDGTFSIELYRVAVGPGGGSGLTFVFGDQRQVEGADPESPGKFVLNFVSSGFFLAPGMDGARADGGGAADAILTGGYRFSPLFELNGGLTLTINHSPNMIHAPGVDAPFMVTSGPSTQGGIKELHIDPTLYLGDREGPLTANRYQLSFPLGIINTRPLTSIGDYAGLSDSPTSRGTRDAAGGSRGTGGEGKLIIQFPHGPLEHGEPRDISSFGLSLSGTTSRTAIMYLPDNKGPTLGDGFKLVAALGGEFDTGPVNIGLVAAYSMIFGGSMDGNSMLTVEPGLSWVASEQYARFGLTYRFSMPTEEIRMMQHQIALSWLGTLYRGNGWQFDTSARFDYTMSSGDMCIGCNNDPGNDGSHVDNPDNFGNDIPSQTQAGPMSMDTTIASSELSAVATPMFRFGVPGTNKGLYGIGFPLGLVCSGQDAQPDSCGFMGGIIFQTMFDPLLKLTGTATE